jgi:hypothetical protein
MSIVRRLFLPFFGIMILLAPMSGLAGPARAEGYDCPVHPESTYTLSGDLDDDRAKLESLVDDAKAKGAVCIIAYYDGAGPANSKMLAFRRANWAMEQLTKQGVPSNIIARALHASQKANDRTVQVILGP